MQGLFLITLFCSRVLSKIKPSRTGWHGMVWFNKYIYQILNFCHRVLWVRCFDLVELSLAYHLLCNHCYTYYGDF